MKIIALGDTHGRDTWKKIVLAETFDKIVFIGDYFDSYDHISAIDQIENFKQIIAFKKTNPENVILLIGNHDYHYLIGVNEQYSGFQSISGFDIRIVLEEALAAGLIDVCCQYENFIFSHAGITKTWLQNNGIIAIKNMVPTINAMFKIKRSILRFVGSNPYGDQIINGPIWVRPKSLMRDGVFGDIIQIVGHTKQEELLIYDSAAFIDCLGTSGEYLVIDLGMMITRNIDAIT